MSRVQPSAGQKAGCCEGFAGRYDEGAGNDKDGIYKNVRDQKLRDAITVDFAPLKNSKIGELAANFNVVLGVTPESK